MDGINRHVGDLRFGWREAVQDEVTRDDSGEPANAEHIRWLWEDNVSSEDGDGEDGPEGMEPKIRRSERIRRLPDRYRAYVSH